MVCARAGLATIQIHRPAHPATVRVTVLVDLDDSRERNRATPRSNDVYREIRDACLRVQYFGALSYGAIKNILRQTLDQQPLHEPANAQLEESPRFARPDRRR